MKCSVRGCRLEAVTKGYCRSHYARWWRTGDPGPAKIKPYAYGRGCAVKGCKGKHAGHGYCNTHMLRWQRFGDPLRENVVASDGEPAAFVDRALNWKSSKCLFWPYSCDQHGRAKIATLKRGRKVPAHVSRIVCIQIHGKPPTRKHEAAHNCGNGHLGCVNPLHIQWKTHAENCADTVAHDMSTRGGWHGGSKLNRADVRKIRQLISGGKLLKEIAARFGVDPETIGDIKHGRSWSWLE